MDMMTYAMAKPKVIDLDSYGISEVILGLFAGGGGSMSLEKSEQFWDEVNTDRELRLVATGMGNRFVIDQCTRTFYNEGVLQIYFAMMIVDSGTMFPVNVAIVQGGNLTTVYVTVT